MMERDIDVHFGFAGGFLVFSTLAFSLGYLVVAFVNWDFYWLAGIGEWQPATRLLFLIAALVLLGWVIWTSVHFMKWEQKNYPLGKRNSAT